MIIKSKFEREFFFFLHSLAVVLSLFFCSLSRSHSLSLSRAVTSIYFLSLSLSFFTTQKNI